MARPAEFDRTKALNQAMKLFWKHGYDATSVSDLGAEMGLKPGSLYNAFHDKHTLFLETLDVYQQTHFALVCKLFEGPLTGKEAIRQFFISAVTTDWCDPDHKGCFMVNSATELAARDPEVRRRAEAARRQTAELLQQAVVQAQADGEIDPARNPTELADFLVTNLFGLRVVAKTVTDQKTLLGIVNTILVVL